MGALLGLDMGTKRVGVAVSDEGRSMALPLTTLFFSGRSHLLKELEGLVEEYRVEEIVVGLPKTLKGEMGIAAEKIQKEVEWFETRLRVRWTFWDERLTTQEVERVLLEADVSRSKRKEVRDQLAAQRILQNYIDFKRNRV